VALPGCAAIQLHRPLAAGRWAAGQHAEGPAPAPPCHPAAPPLPAGDLSHLQEQLAKTEARLDRAKQSLYFPEVKGYR
jgi:hypothetical protein